MFTLPDTPVTQRNPLNDIMQALRPIAQEGVKQYKTKQLLDSLRGAQNPQDKQFALQELLSSPYVSDKTKEQFSKQFEAQLKRDSVEQLFNQGGLWGGEGGGGFGGGEGGGEQQQQWNAEESLSTLPPEMEGMPSTAQLGRAAQLNPQATNIMQKNEADKRALAMKERHRLEDKFEPARKKISDEYEASQEAIRGIKEQMALNESGKMSEPITQWFADKLGLPALATVETQRYNQITAEKLKGAKAFFGSRVTDYDIKAFMKMLSTATNSKEGRAQLLKHEMQVEHFKQLRYEAMREQEARGITRDINERIQDNYDRKAKAYMDDILSEHDMDQSGVVPMKFPDGRIMKVPKNEVPKWEKVIREEEALNER